MLLRSWMKYLLLIALLAWLLAGCGAIGGTPQALPTVVLDPGGTPDEETGAEAQGTDNAASEPLPASLVAASGSVAPAQSVTLAFAMAGSVQTVEVQSGDPVQAGQVLARLSGSERLAAAVMATKLELLAAQQAVTQLNENAGQARAQAQLRLANAKDAYDTALKRRGWKEYRVGDDDQIAVARADLILAEDALKRTEEVYGGYADSPEDNLNKAAALSAISAARQARTRAQANLNYLLSLPDAIAVEQADAELEVARSELDVAQREFDRLQSGPDPEALALANARIENAVAQLAAAEAALADLELKAPFDGVVTELKIVSGAWIVPGQAALVLADLNHLQVETSDLSERDVPQVFIGQAVVVQVKALNEQITGKVSAIAPLADTLGGDVIYKTTILLDTLPPALRAGMSVEVQFLEGE